MLGLKLIHVSTRGPWTPVTVSVRPVDLSDLIYFMNQICRNINNLRSHFMKDIKNNAWVTVNNDFLSRVRRFGNDFHEWQSHEWVKIIAESPREWQKSLFTVTNLLFYFLHAILCHEHTNPLRTLMGAHFAIVAKDGLFWSSIVTSPHLICDVMRTRNTGIVTSYLFIVIARANWRKGDLH